MSCLPIKRSALALALVGLGHALGAQAQSAPSGSPPNGTVSKAEQQATQTANATHAKLAAADRQFAEKAAEGGMGEVETGKLAGQKAQSDEVKQFSQRMVQDHTKAGDQLKQIAASKGVDLPSKLDKSSEKELDELGKLSGDQFDKAYIKKQVSDHKKVVQEFQKEAKSGNDADLRNFANSTLPTLQEHLKLAQTAEQKVVGKSSTPGRAKPGSASSR